MSVQIFDYIQISFRTFLVRDCLRRIPTGNLLGTEGAQQMNRFHWFLSTFLTRNDSLRLRNETYNDFSINCSLLDMYAQICIYHGRANIYCGCNVIFHTSIPSHELCDQCMFRLSSARFSLLCGIRVVTNFQSFFAAVRKDLTSSGSRFSNAKYIGGHFPAVVLDIIEIWCNVRRRGVTRAGE